jgi:carboxylesterase type B
MLDAWVQFARCGDPSHEALGAWHPYDPATRPTMRLGLHCQMESDPLSAYHPFWRNLL